MSLIGQLESRTAALLAGGILFGLTGASTPAPNEPPVDFALQIRPILSAKCLACHGPDESSRKAKLRLDQRAEALRNRDGTRVIVPGNAANSELVRRITATDPDDVMPPPKSGHTLDAVEVGLLRRWISEGAAYAPHWAFVKPKRPSTPQVSHAPWPKNVVDLFILSRIEATGLKPSVLADRYQLIRRLSLDLVGLPPEPADVEAFVHDPRAQAYEDLVDRLLSSPHFGERWARVWLDLARYADSAGHGSDPLRLNIWPYRDWVISALNRNLPYDQFLLEQIAGDLLPEASEEQHAATAFHRNTMTNTEGGTDDEEWRVAAVKDRANVTGQAIMGLTFGCAQCHSHKFDPISHREYYQFFAFFNQTEDTDQPDERPTLPLPTTEQRQQMERLKREIAKVETELEATSPELQAELARIKPVALPVMRELPPEKQRVTRLLNKGNFLDPGDAVTAAVPAAFHPLPAGAPTNRSGLAQWLVSRDNPLTARVAVNRFWAQLFGTGLVETEEDFGTQGALPTHPELLDWLAVEFMDTGWDMKALLKTLVMSATYQQSSRLTPVHLEKDPRNQLCARMARQRLSADAVRDQALALSGLLSRKMGGPSVYPPQPEGLWRAAFNGERTWPTSAGEDRHRRGLYTFWRRTVPYPSMATFDAPSAETCTFRRLPTNTPLQAYVTLNDPVFVECAQALGRRLWREGGATAADRIRFGLRLCLSRPADESQVQRLFQLYEAERASYGERTNDALKLATDPLGPLPEGLSAAEGAAWTVIGNVLLNLDAVLTKS